MLVCRRPAGSTRTSRASNQKIVMLPSSLPSQALGAAEVAVERRAVVAAGSSACSGTGSPAACRGRWHRPRSARARSARRAAFELDLDRRAVGIELDLAHPAAFEGARALGGGIAEQQLVELGAAHLPGVGHRLVPGLGELDEAAGASWSGETNSTPHLGMPMRSTSVAHAEPVEQRGVGRQQRLADVEARMARPSRASDHVAALLGEQGGDGRAGGAAADDENVAVEGCRRGRSGRGGRGRQGHDSVNAWRPRPPSSAVWIGRILSSGPGYPPRRRNAPDASRCRTHPPRRLSGAARPGAAGALGLRPGHGAAGVARVRFASVAEGRAVLGADDACDRRHQRLPARRDRRACGLPMSRQAFQEFAAGTVQPWPDAEAERWQAAVGSVMARAAALRVPLPAEILLINTDGRDAANPPYTRGSAIVLPTAGAAVGEVAGLGAVPDRPRAVPRRLASRSGAGEPPVRDHRLRAGRAAAVARGLAAGAHRQPRRAARQTCDAPGDRTAAIPWSCRCWWRGAPSSGRTRASSA